jgi:AcrR family transcriptional regulator
MLFMNTHSVSEHRKELLRRRILDAARECFVKEGFQNISMRKLSASIGYSAASLYLYFNDKDEILKTLVEESFGRLAASLAGLRERSENKDPVETLRKAMYTYVDFGLRNPNDYRLALLMHSTSETLPASILAVHNVLRSMVARCLDEGRFRPASTEVTSQALWAAVHGVTSLLIQQAAFPWSPPERLVQQVVGSAISSLQIEAPPVDLQPIAVDRSVA